MIEDPLYLDKKTKVFLLADFSVNINFEKATKAANSWARFGYEVIKHDVNLLQDPDFNIKFTQQYKSLRPYRFKEAYSTVAIMKKMRNRNQKFIITNHNSLLLKDIPRNIGLDQHFFSFLRRKSDEPTGLLFDKNSAHILYKKIVDLQEEIDRKYIFYHLTDIAINEGLVRKDTLVRNIGLLDANIL